MACSYPKCKQFTYCDGEESPRPIPFIVGTRYVNKVKLPIYKEFPRCPTAMVEPATWSLIDHCKQYLAGLLPKDFAPSAQFAEAILTVQAWQTTRM